MTKIFFARTTIRVPTRVFVQTAKLVDPLADNNKVTDCDIQSDSGDSPADKAIRYWNKLDQQVEEVIQKGSELTEVRASEEVPHTVNSTQKSYWSGVDCGIGWCGIVIVLVVVVILVPTLYALYILYYEDRTHDAVL